jgi:peptidoglycan/LPS O-acetylase OafA/YrhL
MADNSPQPRPFLTRVEALRGIGALAVAGFHMSGWTLNGAPIVPLVTQTGVGDHATPIGMIHFTMFPAHPALMMFFVICGCVLRVSLQYGPPQPAAAAMRFTIARCFRIFPIVFAGVLIAAIVSGWQLPATATSPATTLTFGALIKNLLLLDVSLNGSLWAMQLEMLVVPLIFAAYLLERAFGTWILIGAALLTSVLSFSKWAFWPPLSSYCFVFLVGMLIPTLGAQWAKRLSLIWARLFLGVSVLALLLIGQFAGYYSHFSALIESYAVAAIVSLVTYRSDLRGVSFLDSWPLRRIGLASGSYYVLHMPLLPLALPIAEALVPSAWIAAMPNVTGTVVILCALALFAPLMLMSFYLIEAPGMALGRKVNGWLLGARRQRVEASVPAI